MKILSKNLFRALCIAIASGGGALSQQSLAAGYEFIDEGNSGEFVYDDTQDIPWIENETEILAVPAPENLTELRLDRTPEGVTVLIDKTRIVANPDDKIVRVWLWLRRDRGHESGVFEGYRCQTHEYKTYAYANPGREPQVKKARNPLWRTLPKEGSADFRRELLEDYFCGIRGMRTSGEIADRLSGAFRREYFMAE